MAGNGRWLGPSIEQDHHAQQIDAEVSNLNLDDPAAERTRRFLDEAGAARKSRERDRIDDWNTDVIDSELHRMRSGGSSMYTALECEEKEVRSYRDCYPGILGATSEDPEEGYSGEEGGHGGVGVGEAEGRKQQQAEMGGGDGGGECREGGLTRDTLESDEGNGMEGEGGGGRQRGEVQTGGSSLVFNDGVDESGGEWGKMRGKWRERAAHPLRDGQKFFHVDHDAESRVRVEFVMDDEEEGSSSVDINTAELPEGWGGEDPEDVAAEREREEREAAAWAKLDTPDDFPRHGYNMAHGRVWQGLEGENMLLRRY
jgi:hypothetical protein